MWIVVLQPAGTDGVFYSILDGARGPQSGASDVRLLQQPPRIEWYGNSLTRFARQSGQSISACGGPERLLEPREPVTILGFQI
jgi:hypothetical protein